MIECYKMFSILFFSASLYYTSDNNLIRGLYQISGHQPIRVTIYIFTFVCLKIMNVTRAAGAQKIHRGIHRGLVNTISPNTQKPSPTSSNRRPDCKNISRSTINEKSMHLSNTLVDRLILFNVKLNFSYFFCTNA